MLVIDAHLDLSWSALNWNRDLTQEVSNIRESEAGMEQRGRGANTISLPAMRRGEVAICLATLLARANPKGKSPLLDFRNQAIAAAMTRGQLAYYRILEKQGHLRRLENWRAIETHLREWQSAASANAPV